MLLVMLLVNRVIGMMMVVMMMVLATMVVVSNSVTAGGAEEARPRCTAKRSQATNTRPPQQLCKRSFNWAVTWMLRGLDT